MLLLQYTSLDTLFFSFADEPLQNSTLQPRRFFGDVASVTGSPPSALPALNHKAFESSGSPGAQQSISGPGHNVMATDIIQFKWGNDETSRPLKAISLPEANSHPLSKLSLNPSKPVLGANLQIWTTATLGSDWAATDSAEYPLSPNPRHQHPGPETALNRSGFSSLTASRLSLISGQEFISNHQQEGVSGQTLAMMTSLPGHTLHPADLTFADSPINQSYNLDLSPSSGPPLDRNQPAHTINTLSHQGQVLAPDYNVPFILPHPASPSVEPTDASPDDFYPTNTMEIDWGSGDYLETLTFLDSNGEDYSPVTKVLSDAYELEDYTESYDTAFPSRVGIFPSSSHPFRVSPTPSLSTDGTATPLKPIYASPSPSTVRHALKPTPTSRIPHASDVDWADTFTIQPTDVLLPDMNSLEYYTTQLSRENNSVEAGAEHRNASTVSISPTEITPTSSFINDTAFSEGGSSGSSGFEPQEESSTASTKEESPRIKNTSVAFLDPSIVPTHLFNPSSFSWDAEASVTDWPTSAVTPGIDSTILPELLLPTVTPLLSDSALPYSSLTDVHWFVTESIHQGSISSALGLSSATALFPVSATAVASTTSETIEITPQDATTEQIFNISLLSTEPTAAVTSPNILSDQGVTEDGTDVPATLTLIPPSSDANTVSDIPVTTTATNTSHQAVATTAATAVAATNVNIMSTTSRKTPTNAPASRQYFCNVDRPVYLVKIGKSHIYNMYYFVLCFPDNVKCVHYRCLKFISNYFKMRRFITMLTMISSEGFPPGVTVGYAKSQVKDILKAEFNKSVELQVNKHLFK